MAKPSKPSSKPRCLSTETFFGVLSEELRLIRLRRGLAPPATPHLHSTTDPHAAIRDAQEVSTFGLAFSGGGIRSATFNLGVTQALAERKLLRHVDYLSTVSGGGYIGSWLHSVVKRHHPPAPNEQVPDMFDRVDQTLITGVNSEPGTPDTDPIAFLRKYSNYLAPRTGLFSADTWVMVVIWVRNVLLNQLILAPAIVTLVAAAMLAVLVRQVPFLDVRSFGFNAVAAALAVVGFVAAVLSLAGNLAPIARQSMSAPDPERKTIFRRSQARLENLATKFPQASATVVVLGVFAATIGVALGDFDPERLWIAVATAVFLVVLMMVIQSMGGFVECFAERHKVKRSFSVNKWLARLHVLWMSTVSGLVTTALIWAAWRAIASWKPWHVVGFAPPLAAACVIAGVMLLVGLMGADYPDAAREWTARIGSRFAMLIVGWSALFALTVDGPPAVARLVHRLPRVGPATILGWLGTTLGGVLAGRSPSTGSGDGKSMKEKALEILVSVAPTMFLIAYVIAIAAGTHALLSRLAPPSVPMAPPGPASPYATHYWHVLTLYYSQDGWSRVIGIGSLIGAFGIVTLVASTRVNVNEFSLHHFYKNRLVRCYLGASRSGDRTPNPLTGFDPQDDFPLATLSADPDVGSARQPYYGPYPIVNATLNLNAGSELAQQERKAASFIFTPAFCGFDPPTSRENMQQVHDAKFEPCGYRATRGYSQPSGPAIGTTMAISGAAANPNWGYHTSGPVAFLLTVFNARLGWWLGNPRWPKRSTQPGPVFAFVYLIAELLGQTTGRSKFVNLSDGGHFENLGLYELIRRRCRFIIVCDSEEDGQLTFGSLGGVIRKCRADFGVEIDINPNRIRKNAEGYSKTHCVIGRIRYPEPETVFSAHMTTGWKKPDGTQKSMGWLLYLKSSLTGDEPADVKEYHSQFPEFPHQSTADQFFSESQFESYRRLGYHVCGSAFEGISLTETPDPKKVPLHTQAPLINLFQDLARKWYEGLPITAEAASRLADAYVELLKDLGAKTDTEPLFKELTTGTSSQYQIARMTSVMKAAGLAVLQVMENVYTEFGFEHAFNIQNPRNQGWIETFRKWAKSPILQEVWKENQSDYQPLFNEFFRALSAAQDFSEPTAL